MSSNATRTMPGFRNVLTALTLILAVPVTAQDDTPETPGAIPAATTPPAAQTAEPPLPAPAAPRERINVLVTVPRGEVNEAQALQCEEQADAGTISGEIVVCRQTAQDGSNSLSGSRAEAQKRYAQETAFKGAPRTPDAFGIPDNGKGIGFGGVPPPALLIDVEALPKAPAGSDADRIARGLPPLNEDRELTEEEEKARREAAGIKTATPARPKKKGG